MIFLIILHYFHKKDWEYNDGPTKLQHPELAPSEDRQFRGNYKVALSQFNSKTIPWFYRRMYEWFYGSSSSSSYRALGMPSDYLAIRDDDKKLKEFVLDLLEKPMDTISYGKWEEEELPYCSYIWWLMHASSHLKTKVFSILTNYCKEQLVHGKLPPLVKWEPRYNGDTSITSTDESAKPYTWVVRTLEILRFCTERVIDEENRKILFKGSYKLYECI